MARGVGKTLLQYFLARATVLAILATPPAHDSHFRWSISFLYPPFPGALYNRSKILFFLNWIRKIWKGRTYYE